MTKYIAVLDIGTVGIRVLIGKISSENFEIVGKSSVDCKGIRKFAIVDAGAVKSAISQAVKSAENLCDVKVKSLYTGIRGIYTNFQNNRDSIITPKDELINYSILGKLLDKVATIDIYEDEKLVDVVPIKYFLDDETAVNDPIGLHASSLSLEAEIILGHNEFIKSISECISAVGYKVDGFVPFSVAMSNLLPEDNSEKRTTMLIDVGGTATDYILYYKNRPVFTSSIQAGGDHITGDLAQIFKISPNEAETIKKDYPFALPSLVTNDIDVSVYSLESGSRIILKVSELIEVMQARIENIFEKIKESVSEEGFTLDGIGRIILTGQGIIKYKGLDKVIRNIFDIDYYEVDFSKLTGLKSVYTMSYAMLKYISCQLVYGRKASDVEQKINEYEKKSLSQKVTFSLKKFLKNLLNLRRKNNN
ncbi:MAG: cell division protein FtsA [Clostridiales bacterium]|jgi:cell division protein FtsA|nr:cell division protein FtsA [Clostridiales bacterium]